MNRGASQLESHSKQYKRYSFGQQRGTKQARKSKLNISDLRHATEASTDLDLDINMALTLSAKVECYKLTTGVYGSLLSGTVEITLGRSGLNSRIYCASRHSRWGWQGRN